MIKGLPAIFLLLAACNPPSSTPVVSTTAELRGGSNYNFYEVDNCNRDPYGVVLGYDTHTSTINAQLHSLYDSGQRRLHLYMFHWDGNLFQNGTLVKYQGPASGTLLDSTGGGFSEQVQNNLLALLRNIKALGFEEVEIGVGPQGANNVATWPSWQEAYFQQNWEVIQNVRNLLLEVGLPYRIDLQPEGIPSKTLSFYALQLQYDQRLWQAYVAAYGTADTVGFSISAMLPGVEVEPPNVYGKVYPPVYDIHFYDDSYNLFLKMDKTLGSNPWIIGEAYYNDSNEAVNLQQAIAYTGRRVLYLTQWPLTQAQTCTAVDIAPPALFSNYLGSGF